MELQEGLGDPLRGLWLQAILIYSQPTWLARMPWLLLGPDASREPPGDFWSLWEACLCFYPRGVSASLPSLGTSG